MLQQYRLALAFLFLALSTTWSESTPVIYSSVVNSAANQVTISGKNFSPSGISPTVKLEGTKLAVVSFSNQSVLATLLPSLAAGSYAVTVTNSSNLTGSLASPLAQSGQQVRKVQPGQQVQSVHKGRKEYKDRKVFKVRPVLLDLATHILVLVCCHRVQVLPYPHLRCSIPLTSLTS